MQNDPIYAGFAKTLTIDARAPTEVGQQRGEPVDLTGYRLEFRATGTGISITKSTPDDVEISNQSDMRGIAIVKLQASDTQAITKKTRLRVQLLASASGDDEDLEVIATDDLWVRPL